MKVFLGADHRGFELKEKVAKWLFEWSHDFQDLGAVILDKSDDYTKYASEVASLVADDKNAFGILLGASGVVVEVVANKFDGIRASLGKSAEQVRAGRSDDDMNILVIASDFTSEEDAKKMVKIFLETKFSGKARHERRLEEIQKIEANN